MKAAQLWHTWRKASLFKLLRAPFHLQEVCKSESGEAASCKIRIVLYCNRALFTETLELTKGIIGDAKMKALDLTCIRLDMHVAVIAIIQMIHP